MFTSALKYKKNRKTRLKVSEVRKRTLKYLTFASAPCARPKGQGVSLLEKDE